MLLLADNYVPACSYDAATHLYMSSGQVVRHAGAKLVLPLCNCVLLVCITRALLFLAWPVCDYNISFDQSIFTIKALLPMLATCMHAQNVCCAQLAFPPAGLPRHG